MKSRFTVPVLIAVAVITFSGLTAAQSATSVVKLCHYPPKGTVRQVSSTTTKCAKGEKLLVLGTTGPRGPEGPSGIPGEVGPQGPRGLTGPVGPAGPAGANGTNGATGLRGLIGLTGPAGATGAPGATGPTMVVKDSTGAFIGYLVSTQLNTFNLPQSYKVWLPNSGVIVTLLNDGFFEYTPLDLMFTTADCSGDTYVTASELSPNVLLPITNTNSATLWTTTSAVVVPDATSIDFISTWSSAGGCEALSNTGFTGPMTIPNVYKVTATTSPLPVIVGPLSIGIQ